MAREGRGGGGVARTGWWRCSMPECADPLDERWCAKIGVVEYSASSDGGRFGAAGYDSANPAPEQAIQRKCSACRGLGWIWRSGGMKSPPGH
jgi:hypothetical protein